MCKRTKVKTVYGLAPHNAEVEGLLLPRRMSAASGPEQTLDESPLPRREAIRDLENPRVCPDFGQIGVVGVHIGVKLSVPHERALVKRLHAERKCESDC